MIGLRIWQQVVAVVLVALAGCSTVAGVPSARFITPELDEAFIPLFTRTIIGTTRFGGGVVVAPNIAVTNDHNFNLLAEGTVLARSPEQDLLFFRTDRSQVPMIADAHVGQAVIAYGQDGRTARREARGVVSALEARVLPRCSGCPERRAITYDAEAGEGFSGGPVVDAASGAILGITVGYEDGRADNGGRRMYAIGMDVVMAEMHRLLGDSAH